MTPNVQAPYPRARAWTALAVFDQPGSAVGASGYWLLQQQPGAKAPRPGGVAGKGRGRARGPRGRCTASEPAKGSFASRRRRPFAGAAPVSAKIIR